MFESTVHVRVEYHKRPPMNCFIQANSHALDALYCCMTPRKTIVLSCFADAKPVTRLSNCVVPNCISPRRHVALFLKWNWGASLQKTPGPGMVSKKLASHSQGSKFMTRSCAASTRAAGLSRTQAPVHGHT